MTKLSDTKRPAIEQHFRDVFTPSGAIVTYNPTIIGGAEAFREASAFAGSPPPPPARPETRRLDEPIKSFGPRRGRRARGVVGDAETGTPSWAITTFRGG